jgi:hypothetical protein
MQIRLLNETSTLLCVVDNTSILFFIVQCNTNILFCMVQHNTSDLICVDSIIIVACLCGTVYNSILLCVV